MASSDFTKEPNPGSPVEASPAANLGGGLSSLELYRAVFTNEGIPEQYANRYADAFIEHCIPTDFRMFVDNAHLAEMGVKIGHRDLVLSALRALRAQLSSAALVTTASFTPDCEPYEAASDKLSSEKPAAGADGRHYSIVELNVKENEATDLRLHRWRFDNGAIWEDWNGWYPETAATDAHSAHSHFSGIMTQQLERFDTGNARSFLRFFADNKPLPFFSNEKAVYGLLLRLPSPTLIKGEEGLQVEVTEIATTLHELMNRLVVIIGQDTKGRPTILTYRKDRDVGWLQYFHREWPRLRAMSSEAVVTRLLRESTESFRPVLQTLQRQLEIVSALPDSYRPKYVVKAFSRIQRQASVMSRSLSGNAKVLSEFRDAHPLFAEITSVVTLAETLRELAGELESNAADMMELRLTMLNFRSDLNLKIFTYFSVMISPLSVITGWFGMNFTEMYELQLPGFYYGVIGFAGGVVLLIMTFLMWINKDKSITAQAEKDAALVLMEDAVDDAE